MYNYKIVIKYKDTEGYLVKKELLLSHTLKYNDLEIEDIVNGILNVIEYDCVYDLVKELIIHLKWCYGFGNIKIQSEIDIDYDDLKGDR